MVYGWLDWEMHLFSLIKVLRLSMFCMHGLEYIAILNFVLLCLILLHYEIFMIFFFNFFIFIFFQWLGHMVIMWFIKCLYSFLYFVYGCLFCDPVALLLSIFCFFNTFFKIIFLWYLNLILFFVTYFLLNFYFILFYFGQ